MNNNIRIMSIEGYRLLKHNREGIDFSKNYDGVFDNSLLLVKLNNLGLKAKNSKSRDLICVTFDNDYLEDNMETVKYTNHEVREILYKDGFSVDYYKTVKKEKSLDETIEYKFFFRSSSQGRVGKSIFIRKELLQSARKWLRMGIELEEGQECKLVEMLSYEALTSSSIENTIKIQPKEILVINDISSFKEQLCNRVFTDNKGKVAIAEAWCKVENILFDGQALLDDSFFLNKNYRDNSFMLLRARFFKSCGFRTHIQKFFKDYCKANCIDYRTFRIKDRYGRSHLAKNIRLITTENSMKWEKFNITIDQWEQAIKEDSCIFGVVKVDHSSKYGNTQQSSYQMINSLPSMTREGLETILSCSIDNINSMKNNNDKYIEWLGKNACEFNNNELIVDLVKHNKDFTNSEFFKVFKSSDINKLKNKVCGGKVLVPNANNLTIVGNPYLMLEHAVGAVNISDNKLVDKSFKATQNGSQASIRAIKCYTNRFNNGLIACFRNPHNSPSNIGLLEVIKSELIDKYFGFNNNIIAIDLIENDLQARLNGMDMDSDFMFSTDNKVIVDASIKAQRYLTIVNDIKKSNKQYSYRMENIALIDNTLHEAKDTIGKFTNQSQIALSHHWNNGNKQLLDIANISSVLAQIAIDNAKRSFDVDLNYTVRSLTIKISRLTKKVKPMFFKYCRELKKEIILESINCPMDIVGLIVNKGVINSTREKGKSLESYLITNATGSRNSRQIKDILESIEAISKLQSAQKLNKWDISYIAQRKTDLKEQVFKMKLNQATIIVLLKKVLKGDISQRMLLLSILHKTHKELFLSCFKPENQ